MNTNTSMKKDEANANHNESVASAAKNIRPEPISLHVRTAVKAGNVTFQDFNFTSKVNKSTPDLG